MIQPFIFNDELDKEASLSHRMTYGWLSESMN